jgi:hypothetical protein
MNPRTTPDNPLSRLNVTQASIDKSKAPEPDNDNVLDVPAQGAPAITPGMLAELAKTTQADAPVDTDKAQGPVEPELLTDMDLEDFFLTGKLEYTFKMGGKVPIKFRTLSSAELMSANQFLFDNSQSSRSYNVVMAEHSALVLSHCLLQYGQTDLTNKPIEEKEKFVKGLPSPVMHKLAQKYSQFEATAVKLVNDADKIKN